MRAPESDTYQCDFGSDAERAGRTALDVFRTTYEPADVEVLIYEY